MANIELNLRLGAETTEHATLGHGCANDNASREQELFEHTIRRELVEDTQ